MLSIASRIRSASGTTDAEILARALFLARGETLPNRLAKSAASERLAAAERVRSRVEVPLMLTGGLRTARGMAAPIAAGTVDLAGMARPRIGEPDLPRRILAGEADAATVRPPALGFRRIDSILRLGWYEAQLRLLGAGRDPDPALGLWRPLASAARTYLSRR